jgi:hypothetical protein
VQVLVSVLIGLLLLLSFMCNFSFGPCSLEDEAAVGGEQQETTEPEVCYVLLVLKSVFSLPVALSLPFPYISAPFHI